MVSIRLFIPLSRLFLAAVSPEQIAVWKFFWPARTLNCYNFD